MLHAVILAGGGGARLWPLSRANYPKQFLKLLGERTLLQQTVLRLDELITSDRLWIVTGREQVPVVRAQVAALPGYARTGIHILGEPWPRNTATAIGFAALQIQRQDPEAIMVVVPADHWVARPEAFLSLVQRATALANQGELVTLGVVPDRAETGYGYLRCGKRLSDAARSPSEIEAYRVAQFVEKPDLQTAQTYVASGRYYWNTGIFLWQVAAILNEIAVYLPTLYAGLQAIAACSGQGEKAKKTLADVYALLEPISIDYGVLEKSSRLVVMPADIGWSDLGEWTAIHRLSPHNTHGNVLSPNVIAIDSENSFVYSSHRTIATIGLKDMVVVDADDALLICSTNRTQEVKTVVQELQNRRAEDAELSRTAHRPWGTYTVLEEGPNFKVKRVKVYPGAALSLQLHHHRSEHWVIVSGTAQVTNGQQTFSLQTNQSSYVPAGTKHRLANLGTELLEVIEVQTGSYLGEDDIVRFEDLSQHA